MTKPKNEAHWKKFSKELTNYNGPIEKLDWNKFKIQYNDCKLIVSLIIGMGFIDRVNVNFIVTDSSTVRNMTLINLTKYISGTTKIWKQITGLNEDREKAAFNDKAAKDRIFVEEKLFGIVPATNKFGAQNVLQ